MTCLILERMPNEDQMRRKSTYFELFAVHTIERRVDGLLSKALDP